jgi:L-threonylcarbamoyladenylate synthase
MITKILRVDPAQPDPAVIEEAAAAIRDGKLVAFPTETVYGLGAHALDERAVQKIFDAKERPATDPLIVHIAHVGQVAQCASSFPAAARKLALSFWAGPLTLILPDCRTWRCARPRTAWRGR